MTTRGPCTRGQSAKGQSAMGQSAMGQSATGPSTRGQSARQREVDSLLYCVCGKTYDTPQTLKQHQKRYCQGPNPDYTCKICGAPWLKNQSLGQHMRLAHPAEYNQQMKEEAEGARNKMWTPREIREMAEAEARYIGKSVNPHLAELIGRTIDSVKGRRKRPDYREMVAAFKKQFQGPSTSGAQRANQQLGDRSSRSRRRDLRMTEIIEIDSDDEPTEPLETEETRPISITNLLTDPDHLEQVRPSRIDTNPLLIEPGKTAGTGPISEQTIIPEETQSDQVTEYARLINEDTDDSAFQQLTELVLKKVDVQDNMNKLLDRLLTINKISATSMKPRPAGNKPPASEQTTIGVEKEDGVSSKKRNKYKGTKRTKKYKTFQRLFRENKRKLADLIWEDKEEDTMQTTPSIDDVEQEYRKIFQPPPTSDDEPFTRTDCGVDYSYTPITIGQLESTIKSLKNSAPGPDKISAALMRKINVQLLAVLYNAILASGVIPDALRKCRTTLIPKGGDPGLLKNWRPITISSCVLRVFNKILAARLNNLKLHHSQKGFRNIDGCLANLLLVQNTIKEHRAAARPYNIVTIDLQKAFDTVNHTSIARALRRLGIDERVRNLITNQYTDTTTTITCGRSTTGEIPISRGVKQGDPLSPFLFNCILDEFLANVRHDLGVTINNVQVAAIAYADDLVIMSEHTGDTQCLINDLVVFLEKRGLSVNPAKCTAVTTRRVPAKKKLFFETENVFKCRDTPIPQVKIGEIFKYLGRNFAGTGSERYRSDDITLSINNLRKAPLKPQEKLLLLKQYFIPRILHSLQFPNISAKVLNTIDLSIRAAIKGFLHIPTRTTSDFIYARTRDGGLGVLSMRERIPVILYNRILNLRKHNDAFTNAALGCQQGMKIELKLKKMMKGIETKEAIDRHHAGKLELSYSGNGLAQGSWDTTSSAWVDSPPKYWTGYDFVNAVKLKCNMLPTMGIPSNPVELRKCRGGCYKSESLSHVLQACPVTHWKRISRHDRICQLLKEGAVKSDFRVESEPRIRGSDSILKKPDLIIIKEGQATVVDVGIHWEGPSALSVAYANKTAIYSSPPFISAVKQTYQVEVVQVTPFIIGARGVWCSLNTELCALLKLNRQSMFNITADTIKGSADIHKDFGTRVWSRPTPARKKK